MGFWTELGKQALKLGNDACHKMEETCNLKAEYECKTDEQLVSIVKSMWSSATEQMVAKAVLTKRYDSETVRSMLQ